MSALNNFFNFKKAVQIANPSWQEAYDKGVIGINALPVVRNIYQTDAGKLFKHLCSFSYLGLESHPELIQGAIDMILQQHTTTWIGCSRNRVKMKALADLEDAFSAHYSVTAVTGSSCYAASSSALPLLAAGLFTQEQAPVMVFDKHAHFSMNHMKPVCADETEVITCPHDDMDFLEDLCKQHAQVAYITDGVNSMGGAVPVEKLMELQNKYGLFLYVDDSHSLTAYGAKGEGYVKSILGEINDRTIIVSSLAKAFGASGGLLMLHNEKQRDLINRFGGPNLWSQHMNPAAIGASFASIKIHQSPELKALQNKLADKLSLFDKLIKTPQAHSPFGIRIIKLGAAEKAIDICRDLFELGHYTSAVFFPIVARGEAGLRIMLRADMDDQDLIDFSKAINNILKR